MKFSLLALTATFAVASAVDCDLSKITPLLTDPNVVACTSDSGFSFTDLSKLTAESMPQLCASTACRSVLATVKSLGLGDCTLLGMQLETDLLTPIQAACASVATSTGSTAGSSAGSSAGGATVGSSTTTKPDSTGGGSGASASTVNTPAATTTTPAPTTKSSASSVAMTASAAVVAVAVTAFF